MNKCQPVLPSKNGVRKNSISKFETQLETKANLSNDEGRGRHFISSLSSLNGCKGWFFRFVSSRKFLVLLIVLLATFAIVSFVLLLIVNARNGKLVEDAEFLNKHTDWRNTCEKKCNTKFNVPPLLLISMDGFRADYFQHDLTPAVSRILQCGTRSDYMIPTFPSKTFPNHYTIATGLYPESHGIVDNLFMGTQNNEMVFSKKTNESYWYLGEPIWNTVSRNNQKSATFFWPGSEVPIQGLQPTYLYLYNRSTPFSKRVDQVFFFFNFFFIGFFFIKIKFQITNIAIPIFLNFLFYNKHNYK